jgi:Sec-independent protein translocase protein TatA
LLLICAELVWGRERAEVRDKAKSLFCLMFRNRNEDGDDDDEEENDSENEEDESEDEENNSEEDSDENSDVSRYMLN